MGRGVQLGVDSSRASGKGFSFIRLNVLSHCTLERLLSGFLSALTDIIGNYTH
jgi:hypothetical protein